MQNIKKEKGFFTIAQNTVSTNYVRMAYAMALSLRVSQSEYPFLSIGVTKESDVPKKWRDAFDEVIEIPWGDMAAAEDWKLSNEWKAYHMSPYEETIKLDADMLFFTDMKDVWNIHNTPISICSQATTFRGEIANDEYYRQVNIQDNLPNAYSALTYFRKCKEANKFFSVVESIFKEWKEFEWLLIDKIPQPVATTDVIYAMAAKILEKDEYLTNKKFSFVHMKALGQNIEQPMRDQSWREYIPYHFTPKLDLYVGNFKQTLPFHYHDKNFLTDEIIQFYEEAAND